jgi:hypothetical protein
VAQFSLLHPWFIPSTHHPRFDAFPVHVRYFDASLCIMLHLSLSFMR